MRTFTKNPEHKIWKLLILFFDMQRLIWKQKYLGYCFKKYWKSFSRKKTFFLHRKKTVFFLLFQLLLIHDKLILDVNALTLFIWRLQRMLIISSEKKWSTVRGKGCWWDLREKVVRYFELVRNKATGKIESLNRKSVKKYGTTELQGYIRSSNAIMPYLLNYPSYQ